MVSCPACGVQVDREDAFCGECGAEIRHEEVGTLGDPAMTPPWQPAESEPSTPEPITTITPPPRDPRTTVPVSATTRRSGGFGPSSGAGAGTGTGSATVLPNDSRDSELLGQAAPNQQYLGSRLLYQEGEAESLDPLSPRFLKAILMHAVIVYVIWAVGVIVLVILFALILHSRTLELLLLFLWWLAVGIVFWWSPVWVSLSEWKFMLDAKGGAAGVAFQHIASVFRRRETPVTGLKVQRLSLGRGVSRDYLYVQDDVFRGYIACFPYGHDLYIGWSMWWRISPVQWLWIGVVRIYQALTLRGFELHKIHRYDVAKALREALHGAAREGLDAAAGMVGDAGEGTIGADIPLEVVDQPPSGSMPEFR